eukprot:5369072-Pleurochrysis_carterae.AAC.4
MRAVVGQRSKLWPLLLPSALLHSSAVSGLNTCNFQAKSARTSISMSKQEVQVIDSHLHVWSDGQTPFPWTVEPPDELRTTATTDAYVKSAMAAGITGALVVQPANHKFDHSYVSAALNAHPGFLKGMCLANPTLSVEQAVADLQHLHSQGYCAVRFNPYLFPRPDGMDSDVGRALYAKAGELGMPVGVMAFSGLPAQMPAICALLKHAPQTTLIIDHMGFFRQPATGGLIADAAEYERLMQLLCPATWRAGIVCSFSPSTCLRSSSHPIASCSLQVFIKVSALFRLSSELPPHLDLQPRLKQLLQTYGANRLMWGSDFPFSTLGGNTPTSCGMEYAQTVELLGFWSMQELDPTALKQLMGGTAAKIFGFVEPVDA